MMYRPNRTAINCHRTAQTRRLRSKIVVSKRCHPFLESWSPTDFLTNGIEAESTQISVDWSFSSRSSRFFLSFWQPKTWVMPEISNGSIRIRGVDVCVHVYVYIYVEIHIGMEYKLQRPHRDVTGMMANGTTIPLNGKTFSFSVVNYYDLSRHVYIGFAVSFFSPNFHPYLGGRFQLTILVFGLKPPARHFFVCTSLYIWLWINTYTYHFEWVIHIHKSQLFWCELSRGTIGGFDPSVTNPKESNG